MSINAITSTSGYSSISSSSSALSEETKKKLKALGLEPTEYTSEAEAKAAIAKALAQQQGIEKPPQGSNPEETIINEAVELAAAVGVSGISKQDKMDDILDKISQKINEMQESAGSDQTKQANVKNFKDQYTEISDEYQKLHASKNMTGANAIANYNKVALGLAT